MYRIADLNVELNVDGRTKRNAKDYLIKSNEKADMVIDKNYAQACIDYPEFVQYNWPEEKKTYAYECLNYMYEANYFARQLFNFNGIVLHASAVVYEEKAYLFSAVSGMGKSTHTSQWLKLFGDKAFILNDDKPAIRVLEDGIYAYGTPWAGSTDINCNAKARLQGICFLHRDEENSIKPMDDEQAFLRLYHAGKRKLTMEQMEKQLDIMSEIIKNVPIYEMGCTPTVEAAKLSYSVMSQSDFK